MLVALSAIGCGVDAPETDSSEPLLFVQRPLDFVHHNGALGSRTLVEILGPGGAVLDVDGDGDLDLVLRQGSPLDDRSAGVGDRIFLNHTDRSGPAPHPIVLLESSTAGALGPASYGIGAAAGDVDGDGLVDLYFANWGPDRLLRNRGDGTFEDITQRSGLPTIDEITGAAVFFDLDGDGDLDLATGGYTDFDLARHRDCYTRTGTLEYCGPLTYGPAPVRIFLNDGSGVFEDATHRLGLAGARANALGMAVADVDGNGYLDLFVASDGLENHLWMNDGRLLRDEARTRGVAVNHSGQKTGDMGVAFGDVDGDGRLDLISTHLATEAASLWIDVGDGHFEDRAAAWGLIKATAAGTGFGVGLLDADADGRLDVIIANGSVRVLEDLELRGDPLPLRQLSFLLLQRSGVLVDAARRAGVGFAQPLVGRGLVLADFDDDGALDVVVAANGGPAILLQAQPPAARTWFGLDLRLATGAPALGATVAAITDGGRVIVRHSHADGSYASSRDPRVVLNLAAGEQLQTAEIRWPHGPISTIAPRLGHYLRVDAPR